MRITNNHKLPQPFVNLCQRQAYSKGNARLSVTELINSPRIVALKGKHREDIEEDVADMFWRLMGTNIHAILQNGADEDHLPEERLFHEVDGWVISGAIDLQRTSDEGTDLIDWKFTSAYSAMLDKPDWEQQLNCYAWLVRRVKNIEPNKLFVCAIIRDWDKRKAGYESGKGYPAQPVVLIPIRKWADNEAWLFIRERVANHKSASRSIDWGDRLPLCTDADRWVRTVEYAVKPRGADGSGNGSARARRVLPSYEEAVAYAERDGRPYVIEERKGEAVRCMNNYCGVAKWCDQFNGAK